MNSIVTFDTNFIIENKNEIGTIILDIKPNYKLVIARLVIEEVKAQKVRQTIKNYNSIKEKIEESKKENSWIDIVDNTDIENVIVEQENKLDEWLIKAFDNNIVEINNNDNALLENILKRCKYKKPPFNNVDGASDKGFKDTILFINLMDFIKDTNYDEIFLFTNDKVFNKFKKDLEKEFNENMGKNINIISGDINRLYDILNIKKVEEENKEEEEKEKEEEKNEEIFPKIQKDEKSIREKTKEILSNIFWELELMNNWNFITWNKIEVEEVKKLLDNLNEIISKYIFLDKIDVKYIFGVDANKGDIYISDLEKLDNVYKEMSESEKNALAYAITCKFNSYYQELPF